MVDKNSLSGSGLGVAGRNEVRYWCLKTASLEVYWVLLDGAKCVTGVSKQVSQNSFSGSVLGVA